MNQDANTPGFIQVGQIKRSHGLNGELIVVFEDNLAGDLAESDLELVYLRNERGDFYPARISGLQAEGKSSYNTFFVQFEHITDRNSAEKLKGHAIYLDESVASEFTDDENQESELIDHEVFDEDDNVVGLVVDVMDNPAHPILVVATTSGSLLIPFVEHYIIEVSEQNIYCRNLDQLEGI